MVLQKKLPVPILLCAFLLNSSPNSLRAQTLSPDQGRIAAIDESSLVTLSGNRHPLAIPQNDRGEVSPDLRMERMLLVVRRDPAKESSLQRLLAAQQEKSSPDFHAWLTPSQFGQRFGVATADLRKLSAWLQSHGFRVNRIAESGMAIEFSGTAGQVKEAFHTPIHSYVVNSEVHYANSLDPQIPSALTPVVAGIATLHNFRKKSAIQRSGKAHRLANSSLWQPEFTFNGPTGPEHFLAPGDFAKIYNTASLYKSGIDGTGQSVAIVARNNINLSDVQIFRLAFGLPVNDPQIILDGPDPGNLGGPEETEADLDVEWSGAIAPKAIIKFVVSSSTNSTDGVDLSALYIVDNNLAPVLSASFGECEQSLGAAENAFFSNLWEQAAAQGITVVISSGDNGPAGCDNANQSTPASKGPAVSGLASTPFNIALGGTQFNENGADSAYWSATNNPDQSSALGYIPEVVWNESCADPNVCGFASLAASSGGASTLYSKPSWQAGPGVPNDGKRDLPDVSLDAAAAHDGYLICQGGICTTDSGGKLINAEFIGGTSAGTPTFAAIMALIVQKTNSRQGQANFVLYPLGASQNPVNCNASAVPAATCIFNDVTQGNNNVPGQNGAPATASYDLATGLGSVNAASLAANWQNILFRGTNTTLQLSGTNFTHGQSVTATVSVAPSAGSGTPTGDVSLLAAGTQGVNLGTLIGGTISGALQTLAGGSYNLSASYAGDATFGSSISPGVAVNVSPEASTTTFSAFLPGQSGQPQANPVNTTYGFFLEFQVNVTGASKQGSPTGALTFTDTFNGTTAPLLDTTLNSKGNALLEETQLALGNHVISVSYLGDSSFNPSSAGPINVAVAKGPTQTILFTPVGALPNSSVVLQAIVLPNGVFDPTGTVQFFDGKNALGPAVTIKNLVATLTTMQLANGSNSITATYSGDANFLTSTSAAATVFVDNPDFQISANPGNITINSAAPGTTQILLTPGPGLGLSGVVSLACSGLPVGSTCTFVPGQPNLDGFDPVNVALSISRPSPTSSVARAASLVQQSRSFAGSAAGVVLGCVLFCCLRRKRQPKAALFSSALSYRVILRRMTGLLPRMTSARSALSLASFLLLAAILGALSGCSNSGKSVAPPSNSPSANSFVATVTASGGTGAQAVTHSVTLAVTVQ